MSEKIMTVDITPTPRILRVLGEIPFAPWQCLAELIDNAIDAFLSREGTSGDSNEQKINITWSGESVAASDRTVEVTDNAMGMSLEQIQNAVRAGYSSNDPINNLGLFGMGFNIATARLGDLTTVLSTRKGDHEWVGLTIDFQKMNATKTFEAPVIRKPKENIDESGTKIIVSNLKQGIRDELSLRENDIRKQLESIYTPLLNNQDIVIYVKGKQLFPRNHCVWAQNRYVVYNQEPVYAYQEIDRDLGTSLFDLERNCYLSADEAEPYYVAMSDGKSLPDHIVERSKRLKGWLGIQRYADPNDFGIDFIRNGRKILISDKSFFQYENPYTGQKDLQYPVELGTSVGGRIVGELYVDYLLPTYQKNDFDKTDLSWLQTREAVCGVGPYLPKARKALGFTEPATSPLGILVNAYRRVDTGTKCLFAPNELAKKYALQFRLNKRDYIGDDLWWKAAQEEDQKRVSGGGKVSTTVNPGDAPTDNLDEYLPSSGTDTQNTAGGGSSASSAVSVENKPLEETSKLDELIQRAELISQMSGKYSFGRSADLSVRAYELKKGNILYKGVRKPCFFSSEGIECNFIYDPAHIVLSQYPISPKMLLLQYLAEKVKARDNLPDQISVYADLVASSMPESRIDRQSLQDRAHSLFKTIREKLYVSLRGHEIEVLKCIHESTGEVEETISNMLGVSHLIVPFQQCSIEGYDALDYVPEKTIIRLFERFPELIFDGKVVKAPYMNIALSDANATLRSRTESKDRLVSFLKDALRLTVNSPFGQKDMKNELSRAALSIEFLIGELV